MTDIERVTDMYRSGLSAIEIASQLERQPHQVYYLLEKAGVPRRSNRQNSRRHSLDETYFSHIDAPEKAYWLGFLFADGSLGEYQGQKVVKVDLHERDKIHLETLSADLSSTYPIRTHVNRTSYGEVPVARFHVTSSQMFDDLVRHGCVPRKTLTLKPPVIEPDLERDFIRGFVDGDGSIARSKSSWSGYRLSLIGTQEMMEWLRERIPYSGSLQGPARKVWSFTAHGDSVVWLYDDATRYLQRKYDRYLRIQAQGPSPFLTKKGTG